MPRRNLFLGLALLALAPSAGLAQDSRLGLGLAAVPQYEGASDYRVIAAPNFSFGLGQVTVRSSQAGVEADLIPDRGFEAGPILRYNGGRNPSDIDNAAVSALPQVGASAELGAFAAMNVPVGEGLFMSPRLEVLQGLDGGHEGLTATASLGLLRRSGAWRLGGNISATYADDAYMNSFFSVGAGSASGLAAYTAGGGIKDVGVTAFASRQISDNWSVTGAVGLSRLVGDAADSPIVTQTGNATQGFASLGVSYSWD